MRSLVIFPYHSSGGVSEVTRSEAPVPPHQIHVGGFDHLAHAMLGYPDSVDRWNRLPGVLWAIPMSFRIDVMLALSSQNWQQDTDWLYREGVMKFRW